MQKLYKIQDSGVDAGRLRDMVEEPEVVTHWFPGKRQLADGLAKLGACTRQLPDVLKEGIF